MPKAKLTDEQKRRNRVNHNVTSKINYLNKDNHRAIKDSFLEKYTLCEIPIKAALAYYYEQKGCPKEVDSIDIAYTIIRPALRLSGYEIEDDVLIRMFKSGENRNYKSARDLRNGIVHDLNVQDIIEVVSRKDELFLLLDSLCSTLIGLI